MTSLPGRITDLVTDGVSVGDLRARGDGAVSAALVSVAMSAMRHEWTWAQFHERVTSRCCSRLGDQASQRNGKPADLHKRLREAWQTAERRLPMMREPFTADNVPLRIDVVREWLATVTIPVLSDDDRLVLAVACDIAAECNTDTPALPWRKVQQRTGLTGRRVKDTLARLSRREIMPLVEHGRPQGPSATRPAKANRYRLPVGRAMAQTGLSTSVGRKRTSVDQDQRKVGPVTLSVDQDLAYVSLAVTGTGRAVRAALEELIRQGGVAEVATLPENVVPLRPEGRREREQS